MEIWEKAYEDYMTGMKYKDIASKHGVSLDTVKNWKKRKWPRNSPYRDASTPLTPDTKLTQDTKATPVRVREPSPNLNRGPERNSFARKHGFYAKWLPEDIQEILGETPADPLEILWTNIQLQHAKIIHSFKIQSVKDKDDLTSRVVSSSEKGETYQFHEAFQKDSAFLQGLSRALATLNGMIANYEKLIHENWELASELQKARLDQAKAEAAKIKADLEDTERMAVQVIDDIPERSGTDE